MRYTPYGGAEVFISRLVDGLIKRGHECHIFANKWKEDKRDGFFFHKVGIIRWPSFLRVLSFAIGTYLALKKNPVDVIISFDRTFYQDIYRAGDGCHKEWLEQRFRISDLGFWKRIITYLNPLHITILYLEKKLFQSKRLKFVIANSKRGKEEIIKHYGLPEDKICVIYNGIDHKGFDLAKKDEIRTAYRERLNLHNQVAILFVGSGFERKGLRFLIEAVGILKREGCNDLKIVVVGKGRIKKYQDIAERCGIGGDINFIGPVKDIKGYYNASDIFILPTIYEPFSNACLEAMAAGLPVVTSKRNGVAEIITHKKDGYLLEDPTNPYEVVEAIRFFLSSERRKAIGIAASITARSYSIERSIDEMLLLFTTLTSKKGEIHSTYEGDFEDRERGEDYLSIR